MASLISQLVSPAGRFYKQHFVRTASSYHPNPTMATVRGNNPTASALGPLNLSSTPKKHWTSTGTTSRDDFDHFRLLTMQNSTSSSSTDDHGSDEAKVETSSWIDLYFPRQARPYALLARLHKPIIWLFAWPCMWAIGLAASPGQLPDIKMLTLFVFWSLFVRSIAFTINDIFDRDIDAMVERTKSRPLASGVLSPIQGVLFLGFQLLLGFGVLLQLNNYSRVLGTLWLLPIFTYPLFKRFTYWPQAYLGFMINWGALVGWTTVKGSITSRTDPAILFPLYISGACWTLVYDTIYAHQDKKDDEKVGAKSTALKFGDSTKQWLTGFAILCIASVALCGYNAAIGLPFYALLVVASGQLAWQIWTVDLSSPLDCYQKFESNKWFGAIIFTGILLGRLSS